MNWNLRFIFIHSWKRELSFKLFQHLRIKIGWWRGDQRAKLFWWITLIGWWSFKNLKNSVATAKWSFSIIGPAPWSPAHSSPANYSVQKCFVSIPVRLRPEIVKDSWIALDISRGANKWHNERKVCLMKLNAKDM